MSEGTVLMTAEEIDRALSRIAHQVLEYTGGAADVALVGIHTRGVPLARRLAWKIARAGEEAPPVGILDINMYRDDLSSADSPVVRRTDLPFKVGERQIVLVDDVLFTGRTIRSALDALLDLGRPRAIRLAVLIDRGARELPIQPDFCGRTLTAPADQVVDVRLAEIDGGPDQVVLRLKSDVAARARRKLAIARGAAGGVPRATASAPAPKSRAPKKPAARKGAGAAPGKRRKRGTKDAPRGTGRKGGRR